MTDTEPDRAWVTVQIGGEQAKGGMNITRDPDPAAIAGALGSFIPQLIKLAKEKQHLSASVIS